MDISIFDYEGKAAQGYDVAITNPATGKDTDLIFTVYGSDSRTLENARIKYFRAMKDSEDDTDAILKALCEFLAAATKGWSGMMENGKEVPFSHEKAADIYYRYKGLREQIDKATGQRSRLFQTIKED